MRSRHPVIRMCTSSSSNKKATRRGEIPSGFRNPAHERSGKPSPDEEKRNAREGIAFPDQEKQNPSEEMTFPDEEKPNARRKSLFLSGKSHFPTRPLIIPAVGQAT